MPQSIVVVCAVILVALIGAVWGSNLIAHTPASSKAEASGSIDVMQMMKKANSLSEESFPAH
jgi:hypothetical protein